LIVFPLLILGAPVHDQTGRFPLMLMRRSMRRVLD
jgi:hypothetical protein